MQNHEFYAGTNLTRYLDSTWQEWGPLPDVGEEWGEDGLQGATSATSALGAFLSAGNHHGPGVHATVPSKSSRYFSVDFGLTHLVGLSFNGYNGVDLCTTKCNEEQKEWLKKDLAAVDRTKTPCVCVNPPIPPSSHLTRDVRCGRWVIAFSHFPMYLTQVPPKKDEKPLSQQAWYTAEECEYEGHDKQCKPKDWEAPPLVKDKEGGPITAAELEPIFMEYGVGAHGRLQTSLLTGLRFSQTDDAVCVADIYWAGHIHFYET